jgi:hypothetical protein
MPPYAVSIESLSQVQRLDWDIVRFYTGFYEYAQVLLVDLVKVITI